MPPALVPTTSAFSFLTLDEMSSFPSKLWVPSPVDFARTICLKFCTFPLHSQFITASWITSINMQTCCNGTYICFWVSSWELHILLVVSFDSSMYRFSKCYMGLSLTFDHRAFHRFPKPLISCVKSLSAWKIWSDFYFPVQILTDTYVKLHCLITFLHVTLLLGMLCLSPRSLHSSLLPCCGLDYSFSNTSSSSHLLSHPL